MNRLPVREGEAIRRDRPLRFRLDGRTISAFEGDTIGSALAAAGVDITGRSFKYHRPRGLTCMTGSCPNCMMQVDGIPNVRACTEPVRDGMTVKRQNAWPSVDRDIHGWLNKVSFMMPPGFYYKVFQHPRWAWPLVEPFIRSKAGLGRVPREEDHEPRERITLHPDVLVIGAGGAGLAAAAEAAAAGLDTLVVEQDREAGGSMRRARDRAEGESLGAAAEAAGARILTGTAAFGVFEGPLVAAASARALYRVRPRHLVVATGAIEQPAVFPNNDLPGIMLSSAVESLVHRSRVLPGRDAVVMTSSDAGHETARTLVEAGARVSLVDLRPDAPPGRGFRVAAGKTVLAASGRRRVTGVTIGEPGATTGPTIECDLLVLAGFTAPSTNLLSMSGAEVEFDDHAQAYLPRRLPDGVYAVGAVAGAVTHEAAVAQGRLAGLEIGVAHGSPPSGATERVEALREAAAATGDPVVLPPEVGAGEGKQFACLCMDVTDKELSKAVAEGFDSMELLKRYTTITMGPCQGKACMVPSQRLCARATGSTFAETKRTTSRPPWVPVELGTLAGARRTPRKETTMHDVHTDAGADIMWAGDWRRPHHFSTPEAEVRAVRTGVGRDRRVHARQVPRGGSGGGRAARAPLSEPFRRSGRRPGSVRGDAQRRGCDRRRRRRCARGGRRVLRHGDERQHRRPRALDDVVARGLAARRAAVERDRRVRRRQHRRAEGPRGHGAAHRRRRVDRGVALPRLGPDRRRGRARARVAHRLRGRARLRDPLPVDVRRRRVGRIMDAGRRAGIVPFGLEAQRILRLEKQHILVGQDTDAESDPYEVGLGWMVKADKHDFLGKRSLADLEAAGPAERLVGFTCEGSWLPPEGASIVHDGTWVGQGDVGTAERGCGLDRRARLGAVGVGERGHAVRDPFRVRRGAGKGRARPVLRPPGREVASMRRLGS